MESPLGTEGHSSLNDPLESIDSAQSRRSPARKRTFNSIVHWRANRSRAMESRPWWGCGERKRSNILHPGERLGCRVADRVPRGQAVRARSGSAPAGFPINPRLSASGFSTSFGSSASWKARSRPGAAAESIRRGTATWGCAYHLTDALAERTHDYIPLEGRRSRWVCVDRWIGVQFPLRS